MRSRAKSTTMLSIGVLAAGFVAAAPTAQAQSCNPDARDLFVTFQPVDHTVTDAVYFLAQISLANRARRCTLGGDWSLYFSSVRQPAAVLAGPNGDIARQQLAGQGLSVARADRAKSGDFYVLKPASGFVPLRPGQTRRIAINIELWATHKSDAPAGWSIAYGRGPARWVPAKALLDPNDPKQTKAFSGDVRPVQNAGNRFTDNTAARMDLNLRQRIVPQPLTATASGGSVGIGARSAIRHSRGLGAEAGYLRSALGDVSTGPGAPISLRLDRNLDVNRDGKADADGYTLRLTGGGVEIAGRDRAGVLYGIQTLRQLISAADYKRAAAGHRARTVWVPRAWIADAPLFGFRGLQIDVARHFETKQTVMKFLDLMAFLKLNKLHFHVSDDEGWRVEIPGLPELTGFGSKRAFDLNERGALHQGMGSVNDLRSGDGIAGKADNRTEANLGQRPRYQGYEQHSLNFVGKGSGFYSARDFTQILAYAKARHIEVMPEFDFPAHARAAVQSMERRFQRTGDATYRLLDPADTSQHVSVQLYNDNLINPCLASTYRFLTKVVTEVGKMYRAAGASRNRFHLGGDEPPGPATGWWNGSPACAANPDTAGKTGEQLADLFFTRWNDIALRVFRTSAGWEDVTEPTRELRLRNFAPLPWQNVWGWGREDWAYRFANEGTPVILAHATNLYMDLAYNKDPDEPGYYWANYVDEKNTFTYQPFNVFENATETRWGAPFTPDPAWVRLTEAGKKNILGMEALLWAENGKTEQIREYQAFPKLLGAAERSWNRETPSTAQMPAAWNVFNNTLGQVTFPLLSFYRPVGMRDTGVNYRIPLPGGKISGGVLTANVRNPGMTIEYSTNGGATWSQYRGPVRVGASALLRTRAVDGRTSRIAPVQQ